MAGLAKGVGDEGGKGGVIALSRSPAPLLPSPFLHRPRRARKALTGTLLRWSKIRDNKVLIFSNILTSRGGYMLVTCYVLLAKKSGTVPQMIPNFKGGFRGGPRDQGAEEAAVTPFSLKFCIIVIELSEK